MGMYLRQMFNQAVAWLRIKHKQGQLGMIAYNAVVTLFAILFMLGLLAGTNAIAGIIEELVPGPEHRIACYAIMLAANFGIKLYTHQASYGNGMVRMVRGTRSYSDTTMSIAVPRSSVASTY